MLCYLLSVRAQKGLLNETNERNLRHKLSDQPLVNIVYWLSIFCTSDFFLCSCSVKVFR